MHNIFSLIKRETKCWQHQLEPPKYICTIVIALIKKQGFEFNIYIYIYTKISAFNSAITALVVYIFIILFQQCCILTSKTIEEIKNSNYQASAPTCNQDIAVWLKLFWFLLL